MNRRLPMMIDPTWVGGIAGMIGALFVASLSLGQVPVPDVAGAASETVQSATETAQEATKTATDTASDATKSATDTASDATKSATDTARDATKSATDTARDATKGATDTARDATKSATGTARDAAKNAGRTGRDAAKSATDTARDAAKSGTDAARDATRSATDTARDAARSGASTARDATRSATDAARDTTRSARDAAKSSTDTARDATRSATDTARDAARDAADVTRDTTRSATDATRDAARSATDTARDATDSARDATRATRSEVRDAAQDVGREARDAAQDVRDTARDTTRRTSDAVRDEARDINREVRDSVNDVRSTARDATQSVIDQNVDSSSSIRSSNTINTSNLRGADLGVWFDRSVRNGLVIADVAADAALAQVGFVEGDRIVSVNGRNVTTEQDFLRFIMAENVRQPVNVVVMRDGVQETLVIDPAVIRERYTTVRVDPLERFGIILDDRITDRLIVWRVIPRSPAFYAGIRAGDEITMFAGQRIADPAKFVQVVERTDPGVIPVQVSRAGRMRQIDVDFPQYQVSEQRTTFRQDLDAATGIETQRNTTRSNTNVRGELNTDADATINAPGASVRGRTESSTQLDTQLPAAPDSGTAQPSQPSSNQPSYRGSGSTYQRRGFFRRR